MQIYVLIAFNRNAGKYRSFREVSNDWSATKMEPSLAAGFSIKLNGNSRASSALYN
jgi:hypothetical protein